MIITNVKLWRLFLLVSCTLMGCLISPIASAAPSAEDTFRFIEKFQHQYDSEANWYNDISWKFDEKGRISVSYYVQDPTDKQSGKDYYEDLIEMKHVSGLEIQGVRGCFADIPKCRILHPRLRVNCNPSINCVTSKYWSDRESQSNTRTITRNSFSIRTMLKGTYRDEKLDKKSLYKIKNAVLNLFEIKGISIEFDDNYFVSKDLFSGR